MFETPDLDATLTVGLTIPPPHLYLLSTEGQPTDRWGFWECELDAADVQSVRAKADPLRLYICAGTGPFWA